MVADERIIESIADLIDRLIIEDMKQFMCEEEKNKEFKKKNPDKKKIAKLDAKARNAGEKRIEFKNAINRKLKEAIESGEYKWIEEVRTYD